MTQDVLSEIIDVTPGYLGQIERGDKNPSMATLDKIAKALKTDIKSLVASSEDSREASIQTLLDIVSGMPEEFIGMVIKHAYIVKESSDASYTESIKKTKRNS